MEILTLNGVEFVRITEKPGRDGFRVLARRDFNPDVHTPYVTPAAEPPSAPPAVPPASVVPPASSAPPAPALTAVADQQPDTTTQPVDVAKAQAYSELNANDAKAAIFKMTDAAELLATQEQEFARENPRVTVVAAIESRLKAIATPAE